MVSPTPDERVILAHHNTSSGEIQLQQRILSDGSSAFEIITDGVFLMADYNQVSERALARHALEKVETSPYAALRILVAGLGMGITLQETLTRTEGSSEVSVDVVEISPYITEWNRTHFAPLNGNVLADPRVRLIQDDLSRLLTTASPAAYRANSPWHAIILDVDNGPSWLAHEKNARLYTRAALERWATLLAPGGTFTVWSAQPEPDFLKRLQAVFGHAEEISVMAPNHKKEPVEYFIYRGY